MALLAVELLSLPSSLQRFSSFSPATTPLRFPFRSSLVWASPLHVRHNRGTCKLRAQLTASSLPMVELVGAIFVDPWAPNVDSQSIASQLFAVSLLPYLGFLYHLTKSKTAPWLTLFGFYFLLAFVGATIPAGIYAKVHYGTSLSNVDWLHGGAESLLTITNLCIVLGLRKGLRDAKNKLELKHEEEIIPLSK